MKKFNHIWIFSDSIKGHEIQSQALASKLSDQITLYHCTIRQPWLSFAPRILPRFGKNIIWDNTVPDISQSPQAIITCGRRMAAIGKYYKRKLNCKHIQILNPGDNPKKYDLLICPEHDGLKGVNIITTKGSLHNVSIQSLAKINCIKFDESKIISVFIGNPANDFFKQLDLLSSRINQYFPQHQIMICGSRRTPKKFHTIIKNTFSHAKMNWLEDKDGKNPYMDLLACSSVIVVTADSINMVSEACATDKPVIVIAENHISPKHKLFISSIKDRLSKFKDVKCNNIPLVTLDKTVQQILQKD